MEVLDKLTPLIVGNENKMSKISVNKFVLTNRLGIVLLEKRT
jgi:hypothetical protein